MEVAEKTLSLPGMISLPGPGCIQDHQHQEQAAVRPKAHSLLLLLNSSLQPFPIPCSGNTLTSPPLPPAQRQPRWGGG